MGFMVFLKVLCVSLLFRIERPPFSSHDEDHFWNEEISAIVLSGLKSIENQYTPPIGIPGCFPKGLKINSARIAWDTKQMCM